MEAADPEDEPFDPLDEALTETFPASDPISISSPEERDRSRLSSASKLPALGNP